MKSSAKSSADCYDHPAYWDMTFRSETKAEAKFIEAACRKYVPFACRRLFEPGCGGGRLVVAMAARGFRMTALDMSAASIDYLQRRLARRGLSADLFVHDMADFDLTRPCDAAFCTFNTFRHLLTEEAARSHLQAVARNLKPGGIYILGLHLIPLDAEADSMERFTARHGRTTVTNTMRVTAFDRRRRQERLKFSLLVRSGGREFRVATEYPYRLYTAGQFQSLLQSVPEFELLDVYDFWYDLDEPLKLTAASSDTVFILRNRGR